MLVIPCPSCGTEMQLPDTEAGKTVACPKCGGPFKAPRATSDAITAEPVPVAPAAPPPTGVVRPDAVRPERSRAADEDERGDERGPRRDSGSGAAAAGVSIGIVLAVVAVVSCCLVVPIGIALLVPAVQKVREAAARTQTMNNMKQIALAHHNHNDTFQRLPGPRHEEVPGKPVELSWRVSILPFIEQDNLFRMMDRNAPWDGVANRNITGMNIKIYESATRPPVPGQTHFQYFTGPKTLFDPAVKGPVRIPHSFPDGTSSTFLFAEADKAVPWARPADMDIQPNGPLPLPSPRFLAAMADGSVRIIDRGRTSDNTLRIVIDPRDGMVPPGDFD